MNLVYTDTLTLTTAEVLVTRSRSSVGDGNLPSVRMKAIAFTTTGTLLIKGTHASSEWITLAEGEGFVMDDLGPDTHAICYIKATESCTCNIFLFGTEV